MLPFSIGTYLFAFMIYFLYTNQNENSVLTYTPRKLADLVLNNGHVSSNITDQNYFFLEYDQHIAVKDSSILPLIIHM